VRRVWSGGGFFEREVSEQGADGRGCEMSCGVVLGFSALRVYLAR
jgi:hypothetical protein